MKKSILVSAALMAFVAAPAFAMECDEGQEQAAGTLAAKVSKELVNKVVPVTGKQMVNLTTCDVAAGTYSITYKYNFLSTDGLYWVDVAAKIGSDGSAKSVKVVKSSPNMVDAQAKSGVKLASN
jgi:hypothetical protein